MPQCTNPYEDWELDLIRYSYPVGGAKLVIEQGCRRTEEAIKSKASSMGVKLNPDFAYEIRRQRALESNNIRFAHEQPNIKNWTVPDEYLQASDIFQVGYRYARNTGVLKQIQRSMR